MALFERLRSIIQEDVGNRGLAKVPGRNLISACPGDLEQACRSIAGTERAVVVVVTGFYIPSAQPPGCETDGPLGAVFLARALAPLGVRVIIATDAFAVRAVEAGISVCGVRRDTAVVVLPSPREALALGVDGYRKHLIHQSGTAPTHLIALERVGPAHTPASIRAQPNAESSEQNAIDFAASVAAEHHDRCHTMRGLDVTDKMSPAHWLFETQAQREAAPGGNRPAIATIAIGDGGNEIGMGKIAWDVIRDNVANGAIIACRVAVDHLLVCGVSNWGAYALAAGVLALRGRQAAGALFDAAIERRILQVMVEKGPLVDGVLGKPAVSVDGLPWETHAAVLTACGRA